ncbi:MAG: FkbM family methyltransferase [Acidobacteria bacterium]|nr:FkbM family methyltransferase [Acidobacteriota bacterium]
MAKRKLKGLFINNVKAQCSIYESGKMVYDCLVPSERYSLDYTEITRTSLELPAGYDFYFFNHHFERWYWLDTSKIKSIVPGVVMTLVLEVSPNDPFVFCSPDDFDAYIVVDPTLKIRKQGVYAFPRPLETARGSAALPAHDIPVIGSFGFGTPGKGFEHVVDAVNREFDRAIVRLNIPRASYWDQDGSIGAAMAKMCMDRANPGIDVIVTHDFMSKEELIDWCRANTLNCFLYDRNLPGLAATTDQAITAGRPMITSKNDTFRHIQKYIKPFPYQTLRQAIERTPANIAELQHDWSPQKFRERFETVLDDLQFADAEPAGSGTVTLQVKPGSFIQDIRAKVALRTRLKRLIDKTGLKPQRSSRRRRPSRSYSQFGEDLIIFNLLNDLAVQGASYLDVGANDPEFISNTFLFYKEGFSGVLVEPDPSLAGKLRSRRPKDILLNAGIGIGDGAAEADFYMFAEKNNGLGTFSAENARFAEEKGLFGEKRPVIGIKRVLLLNINAVIAENFTECPDLISIDIEGWDLQVLKTFDFERYSPAIFCVETLAYDDNGGTYRIREIYELFEQNGYLLHKETEANAIFVNRNLYEFRQYQKANGQTRNAKAASAL